MDMQTRSVALAQLYKVKAELGALYELCRIERAVSVGVFVQAAQNRVDEAIDEFKPDPLPFQNG
jgi:hypothetical protein